MLDSEIEAELDALSDSNESCSETEDFIEEAEPSDSSDSESQSEVLVLTMTSKNGQIKYSKEPVTQTCGRASRENIINLIPGLTRYSC